MTCAVVCKSCAISMGCIFWQISEIKLIHTRIPSQVIFTGRNGCYCGKARSLIRIAVCCVSDTFLSNEIPRWRNEFHIIISGNQTAKQIFAVCICGLCINFDVITAADNAVSTRIPQFHRNILNPRFSEILNTVAVCIIPDKITQRTAIHIRTDTAGLQSTAIAALISAWIAVKWPIRNAAVRTIIKCRNIHLRCWAIGFIIRRIEFDNNICFPFSTGFQIAQIPNQISLLVSGTACPATCDYIAVIIAFHIRWNSSGLIGKNRWCSRKLQFQILRQLNLDLTIAHVCRSCIICRCNRIGYILPSYRSSRCLGNGNTQIRNFSVWIDSNRCRRHRICKIRIMNITTIIKSKLNGNIALHVTWRWNRKFNSNLWARADAACKMTESVSICSSRNNNTWRKHCSSRYILNIKRTYSCRIIKWYISISCVCGQVNGNIKIRNRIWCWRYINRYLNQSVRSTVSDTCHINACIRADIRHNTGIRRLADHIWSTCSFISWRIAICR